MIGAELFVALQGLLEEGFSLGVLMALPVKLGQVVLGLESKAVTGAQPLSNKASSSPSLLPKCFISCDSLVPAARAISRVLVFS